MSENLPDEIISELLSPALKVPEHMFSDTSFTSPFASYSASSSSTLLVCKSWLRVATPLLYSVVVIRSKAQAQALQATLQSAPELGRFVKKLRVEGGFGKPLHNILRNTPNVTDIFVSLQMRATDLTSGLASGLPFINPARLIMLDDDQFFARNKAAADLMKALETCAKKWSNLNKIHFPYTHIPAERKAFCTALCKAPTVKTLSFPAPKPRFDEPRLVPYLTKLHKSLARGHRNKDRGRYTSLLHREPPPRSVAALDIPSHPEDTAPWKLPDQSINSTRLQFLLVSKLFQRLATPYLYRYPIFLHEGNFPAFSRALGAQPALASDVRMLDVRRPPRRGPIRRLETSWRTEGLDAMFSYTRNLTHLIGGGSYISWAAFATVAEIAGGTLQELTGFSIYVKDSTTTKHTPNIFRHFSALRTFHWELDSAMTLPALEFLHMKSPEALSVFSETHLPNLRRANFKIGGDWDVALLATHGSKLQQLEVERATISAQSVLTLCPNITTLTCRVEERDKYDFGRSTLDTGFAHPFLGKLVVKKYTTQGKANEKEWEAFFLSVDSKHLPALREVCVPDLEWPTTEHGISKNVWVKGAEMLLERGIKLIDGEGVEWRPRLKSARGKGKK
ncbi:hypothetical protein B0H17DRAFT_1184307 [Mycena rosella]|uniref:Uncharacterized protein n=1 Tax=Mycena rosella TaxID=1033263 RepID=A0AAD7CWH1_MYCRO|nr:hypothetical protein B0H17DRAFT_1184307 [Mycena rosella]